jgi:HTH-type transcriptional regulator/antitoxin MqsA
MRRKHIRKARMNCSNCDEEMRERTQDEKLSFGGQSLTLHGMKGEFCTKCDEGAWDAESYRRCRKTGSTTE